MFRHYRVILRELVINTLPRYTSISNAAVRNTVYNYDISPRFYASSHTRVTWQVVDYKLPEDDMIVSKHVRV
jgi:predicted transcriptional regulator